MSQSLHLQQFPRISQYRKIARSLQFSRSSHFLRSFCAFVLLAALSIVSLPQSAYAQAKIPVPTVSLAPDVGSMWNQAPLDLSAHGLVEQEYFFEGSTTAKGAYKSRMIVRRPISPDRFNGTVIVELMNASSGFDIDVDFISLLPLIDQEGYAYVAITTQQVSVNFLKNRDPNRYGSLSVVDNLLFGQPAAHEIFSQGAKALLANGSGVDPLGGLKAKRLIAIGQSQSSDRLTTYINTIHGITLEPIFSGYIPHSGGKAPTRFPVPILKLNSENEAPSYYSQRNVANPLYRYWEVPGTSHQPLEGNDYAQAILVSGGQNLPACPFPFQGPGGPVGIDPVLRAAMHYVDQWINTNQAPPQAPLMNMVPKLLSLTDGVILRDKYGNALGGIRMPQQVVPTGRNTPSYGCIVNLFPQWDAFDGGADPAKDWTDTYTEPSSAKALYGSHANYVNLFTAATANVYKAGFILGFDAIKLVSDAVNSNVAN